MKGIINKDGCLFIYRKGSYRNQHCPFTSDISCCGDWCPLFGEPEKIKVGVKEKWKLVLCKKVLIFDEFIDKRKEE